MPFNDPGYKGPSKTSSYLNLKEAGKHQFRIVSNIETYKRYWKNKTPYRFINKSEVPSDVDISTFNGKPQIEDVWAFIAISKDDKGKPEQVGIMTLAQKTIQSALMSLYNDSDYGDFTGYDVVIDKIVEGSKTTYQVTPKPPKPLSKQELEMYESFEPKDLSKKDAQDDPNRSKPATEDIDADEIPF